MDGATVAMLIARYGIPMAYQIWTVCKDKSEMTEQDWEELRKMPTAKEIEDAARAKFAGQA